MLFYMGEYTPDDQGGGGGERESEGGNRESERTEGAEEVVSSPPRARTSWAGIRIKRSRPLAYTLLTGPPWSRRRNDDMQSGGSVRASSAYSLKACAGHGGKGVMVCMEGCLKARTARGVGGEEIAAGDTLRLNISYLAPSLAPPLLSGAPRSRLGPSTVPS